MNGLELVQKHGVGWFCDRYKPKDKEEAIVLEYLKENEGVEKHFTHFLASLSLEVPDDGTFTNVKENNQTKTNEMYTPIPSRYIEDAIEAIQWLDKALDGLKDTPEAYNKLKPYLYGSKDRLDLPLELGELKDKLLELRTKYSDDNERNRKARKENIDSLPTFGADKPSEPLHVAQGSLWC